MSPTRRMTHGSAKEIVAGMKPGEPIFIEERKVESVRAAAYGIRMKIIARPAYVVGGRMHRIVLA